VTCLKSMSRMLAFFEATRTLKGDGLLGIKLNSRGPRKSLFFREVPLQGYIFWNFRRPELIQGEKIPFPSIVGWRKPCKFLRKLNLPFGAQQAEQSLSRSSDLGQLDDHRHRQ